MLFAHPMQNFEVIGYHNFIQRFYQGPPSRFLSILNAVFIEYRQFVRKDNLKTIGQNEIELCTMTEGIL